MKDVRLKIIGKQTDLEGEENVIEFVTEGKFYKKKGAYYLVYNESEISGMNGSTTTLKIQDEKIQMKRYGSNKSKLIFEEGKRHESEYATAYGEMTLQVLTSKLNANISDSGVGNISVFYRLNIAEVAESNNALSIEIM
ncbi:DUF1934 domain-containing protein [Clostridiaceae bacterium M8S5]|nr:DUF1934 domain-containing protein [Clostridiaceae bacterium M8S5]